ncbi:ROK family transcriptional regulator [Variovorax ginsengisoli]|uniref:NBD/HSP70 family sugar kinase n=1 Tax=Variovorax ginsengisoli TaxID=363844 RepID=A0ABT9SAK2_9BURK|nr:ROK family protein [Variovorax ginsengisoli]MDP9901394.1 putative NBD/HSP70 family sugar kinase [Variovorax ginsengisoli]
MKSDGPGRGTNSVNLRLYNERTLLQRLRRAGEASKADLARWAQLTNTAVGSIVQSLEDAGLIEAAGRRQEGQRGQPAGLYRINSQGAYGIGVRLDRTMTETVLVDLGGNLLARETHDVLLPHPDKALALVRKDVARMVGMLDAGQRKRLTGIGLAQPYNLGSWLRELDLKADFRIWDDVDFGAMLSHDVQLPVFKENDGNAAAIAELFFGVGREESDFLYIFIGAALGAGVVIGGESLRGSTGNAADLGLMPVPPSRLASAPVSDRRWDILLSRASLNAMARHLRHHGVKIQGHADLERAVHAHRSEVREWLDDCVDALVPSVRAALAVLDVPAVVIDCDIDAGLVAELMQRLDIGLRDIAPEARQTPRILRGSFRADAGAVGAASLPMFFNFSPRADVLRGRSHRFIQEDAHV